MELEEPSLLELARVIKAGACIEASFKRGKGEAGMDAYQVRTWVGIELRRAQLEAESYQHSLFRYARWVPSSPMVHVSAGPPTIRYGRIARVAF
jgi:hypothetical protein